LSRASDRRKAKEEDDAEDGRDTNREIDVEAPWSFFLAIKVHTGEFEDGCFSYHRQVISAAKAPPIEGPRILPIPKIAPSIAV
jgi:hypothetical protein